MTAEYHRLGDYIREVNVRNRELKVNLSQGICNDKYFQNPKQVADNPETHKIVRTGQFAYNRATTRNGDKLSIALRQGPDCTVSAAYQVFEVSRPDLLLPEYLMMWFKRPEFDRLALFYSHGSAHEFFEWESMCDVQLPVPSIERQREIVSEYETLTSRIRLNNQMIEKLEATAQALYHKTFVAGIDKQNLPQGWRIAELGTLVDIKRGSSPRPIDQYMATEGLPWLKISDATNAKSPFIFEVKEFIKEDGLYSTVYRHTGDLILSNSASPGLPKFLELDSCIHDGWLYFDNPQIPLIFLYLTFQHIRKDLVAEGNGAIFINLKTEILKKLSILLPDKTTMNTFCQNVNTFFALMKVTALENQKLSQIQSLLMAKMGQ